jgi:hypothetical protein
MNLKEVEVGMIVQTKCGEVEGWFSTIQIPPYALGIVTSVYPYGRVDVEFEIGERSMSRPISCYPGMLNPV